MFPLTDQTPDFFRMERSVMSRNNMANLYAAAGDRIAESIIQFICYEHQYNVFGYGILDPDVFGAKFKFGKRYLIDQHPNPFQRQFKSVNKNDERRNLTSRKKEQYKDEEIICDNRIENAFFLLANYPLYVSSATLTKDATGDSYLIRNYASMRVLKQFSIIQNKKTGKIKYLYKLDEDFQRNLGLYYMHMSINSLVALRASGLGSLYAFLLRLRNALFAIERTSNEEDKAPDFKFLCELADINEKLEMKYRKRNLNQAFEKINKETELKFTVEWVRHGNKEKYTPIFHFEIAKGESLLPTNGRAYKIVKDKERAEVAVIEFKHELYRACPIKDRIAPQAEERFYEWIKDDAPETLQTIKQALANTFVSISSYVPADIDKRIEYFHDQASTKPKEEFDKWLIQLFDGKFTMKSREVVYDETIKQKTEFIKKGAML